MRLRLRIERNELPPVQILHAIAPTQLSQTISQFLQTINALFPLESTSWDISDYAVLVGGYEATHYSEIGQAFKDEDEVVIKPLGFAELRARTLTGRDQISEDGRHLLDGVPFGRPMLKRPRRPEVRIPARKRQRTDGGEEGEEQAVVRFDASEDDSEEDDDDDDDEEDEDFEDATVEDEVESEKEVGQDSSDSSSEEDSSKSDDSDSSDGGSGSDKGSDDDSGGESEASWDGVDEAVTTVTESAPKQAAAKAIPKNAKTQASRHGGLPHQGNARTKERNQRRKDSIKLKHLKAAGLLSERATLQDLKVWQDGSGIGDKDVREITQKARMELERKKLLEQIASGGVDIAPRKVTVSADDDDDDAPEEMSSRPKDAVEKPVAVDESNAASSQLSAEIQHAVGATTDHTQDEPDDAAGTEEARVSTRARLDAKSVSRLVFGSLGLRTPKSQEDRDTLQKKLMARSKRAAPTQASVEPAPEAPEQEGGSESWRDRIVLSAVECVDEGVTLSTPSFPFQQRWDPQYQNSKKRKRSRGRKSDDQTNGEPFEIYDKYNQNGGGDALDYDDPAEDDEADDSFWEEGALLNDGEIASDTAHDGFPELPTDHESLPLLLEADAKDGDYIVYQELTVSAATGWEPRIISQIAKLESKDDGGIWTLLLKQDQPKEYDEEGNRVYRKFEMENFSDDGNENQTKATTWAELQAPKLVLRAIDTTAS